MSVSAVALLTTDYELGFHSHAEAQLMVVLRGLVTCEVSQGLWVVPPQCALWIPPGEAHSMRGVGELELYCAYVDPKVRGSGARACSILSVSPLLRELVIAVSRLPQRSHADGRDGRLVATLLDQLDGAPLDGMHLPMPTDRRLRRIADHMVADPADRTTIQGWAQRVDMSERTLCRLLARETGMSFGKWRQQLQILLALKQLSEGRSVQAVASSLGYESASAFVTMFRKAMGKPPLTYVAARKRDRRDLVLSG